MAYDIGPRIGIDGEEQFRKELLNINQSIKTLGSEMSSVVSSFAAGEKSEESMAAQTDVLTRQIEQQRKKIELLNEGLEKSADKYGKNDTKTLKWEQAVHEANAQLNKMESQLKKTGDEVDDLGKDFEEGEKSALSFGDVLKANVIGDALTSGLSAVADGIRNVVGALKDGVVDSAAYADEILTLSTNTGLSTDTLQELQYMAELTDTSLETITGSMAKLTKNMATAQGGTGAAAEAFAALGVNVMNADGSLRSNQDVFQEVIDGLAAMENETQRDALAMQIFGRSAQELNSFMAQGSEGIAALAAEAHNVGYVLDGKTLSALGGVDDALQRFDGSMTSLKNNIIGQFAPSIATGIESLNSFLTGGIDAKEFVSVISDLVLDAAAGFIDALPAIMEAGGHLITELVSGVKDAFPQILAVAGEILSQLFYGLKDGLPMILEAGVDILLMLVDGITEAIPDMIAELPNIITSLVVFFTNNLPKLVTAGGELLGGIAKGLILAIPELVKNLPTLILSIAEGLNNLMASIVNVGVNIVKGIWDGIKSMASWIKEKVGGFFDGVIGGIKDFLGIHSPSRVFAGIGEYMAEGLGLGFEDEMDKVSGRIQKSIPTPTMEIGTALSSAASNMQAAFAKAQAAGSSPLHFDLVINLDGQTLSRQTYSYNMREANLRGGSLVPGVI